ncbi:MAG: histidine triad nucleotide-binding protein [Clostridia bacterium]
MEDCIFCKIIKGEIPSKKVYEDEEILAFYDINPAAPIHILVIPKKHIKTHNDIKNEEIEIIAKIHKVINQIAEEKEFKDNGYRIIINCGKDGGQEVNHLHFHILAGKQLGEKVV